MKYIPIIDVESEFFGIYSEQAISNNHILNFTQETKKHHFYFFKNGYGASIILVYNPVIADYMLEIATLEGNIQNHKVSVFGGREQIVRVFDEDSMRKELERISCIEV